MTAMTAIQFQSTPLSLALQPAKSSYEQLIEWLKQLLTRASQAYRAPLNYSTTSLTFSPSSQRCGAVDLTSVSSSTIEKDMEEAIRSLFVSYFDDCLGEHAAERLNMLFGCRNNWDGQGALEMDLASLNIASHFISIYDLRNKEVGVFMNTDGSLILNWPTKDGKGIVEIEFMSDGYSCFESGMDDSIFFDFDDQNFEAFIEKTL